ncbi:hypothetical protein AGABI1DRAFT_112093 [Agaricus bisporus var. burnettii JB137-S8]|nr:hypothetical protein AGABI2DRAFT_193336 [Agaricus bisporus var. bisporus H97]XP_007327661.1 uncharacterized protein AGABI1DRAFT_112093 [Agaricus bisporus var. burnettii JB137-S8]EKM81858.1 hypothetical protein AGABI1DRAFT_112093 [Agaricus bisporus var. burnettii JB137-S8]EKV46666.1 hypothetical protein AGABI2DRAFT_193336 [Agaricus bisporus var. bisporus H97]
MSNEEHHFDECMPLPLYLQPCPGREKTAHEKEAEEWDRLEEDIYNLQMRVVDISDRRFTFIPESIIQTINCLVYIPAPDDLATLEITKVKAGCRPFARSQTAPANPGGYPRAFGERTRSVNVTSMHGMKNGIHLILSNNMITKLPRSIWDLEQLTVLSLRSNYLTVLPPEICRLKNLEDLNIANNQLQFVPSELLSMNLRVLNLHPNPFLAAPNNSDDRPVSETMTLIEDRALPLTELLYRILVSPAPSTLFSKGRTDTVLSSYHDLPLPPTYLIPPRIAETLDACLPGSVCRSDLMCEARDDISMGTCGNPSHQERIFVKPVEQRLSWEKVIAGQNAGGMVPVMWRGCEHGCLDFLGEAKDVAMDEDSEIVQQIELGGFLDFE